MRSSNEIGINKRATTKVNEQTKSTIGEINSFSLLLNVFEAIFK